MIIGRNIQKIAIAIVLAVSLPAQATTSSGLLIDSTRQTPAGVLVDFKTLPPGCTTSYEGSHAIIKTGNPDLNSIMSLLTQRRALSQAITVTYTINGSCDKAETLLEITGVK